MVWHARQLRARAGLSPMDWIVVRNRLGAQEMHNKAQGRPARWSRAVSERIGFRVGARIFRSGWIFRELFPTGG